MEKTCSKCGEHKSTKEFSLVYPVKKDGRLRPDCKLCVRKRNRIRSTDHYEKLLLLKKSAIKRNREYVVDYLKTHHCVDCGESDIDVLDFDHVRDGKICAIAKMVSRGYRLWRLKDEIAKCEVRCANDHRRITAKRRREKLGADSS